MKKTNIIITFTITALILSCSPVVKTQQQPQEDKNKVSFKAREYYLKGLYLQAEERFSEALIQFHKAQIFDTESATIHNSLAENYLKLNEYEPSLYHLNRAEKLAPDNIETQRLLAEVYFRQRKDYQAIDAYKKILALDPYDESARNFLFFLYDKTKEPLKKAELYKDLLNLYGKDTSIFRQLIELYIKQKEWEKALVYLNESLKIDSTNAKNHYLKGSIFESLKEIDSAVVSFKKAVELEPDENYLNRLTIIYRSAREYQEIINLFSPILEKNPDNLQARFEVAEAHYFLKQLDQSKAILNPLLKKENISWNLYHLLGRIELEEKNYDEAINNFNKVVDLNKENRFGWLFLGFAYSDKGDLATAEETFSSAVTVLPKDASLWEWYGITLQRQKKFSEAIKPFKETLVLDPLNLNALSSLPVVLEELDLFVQSDSIYEVGISRLPDNALLLNNYAYSLSERDIRLEKALEMAQKAIEKEPDSPAYLDTIGWIYYKLNKYSEAEIFILRSLELRPKSAVVLDHMGDVYFKLGDINKARDYWKKSIEIQPDNQTVLDKIANN